MAFRIVSIFFIFAQTQTVKHECVICRVCVCTLLAEATWLQWKDLYTINKEIIGNRVYQAILKCFNFVHL